MYIRDCWYVAAWSHEIGTDGLFTRTILNEPILFMRTATGRVVAMDNRMHSGAKPPGRAWDDFDGALHQKSCQVLTPETDRSTHYFFMQAHSFALDDESVTESIRASVVQAFEEDREMILAQQQMLDLGETRFVPIAADAALNQFRLLLRRLSDAEQAANHSAPTISAPVARRSPAAPV